MDEQGLGHGRPSSPDAPQGCRHFLAEELDRCTVPSCRLSTPEDVQQLFRAKISRGARDVPGRTVVRARRRMRSTKSGFPAGLKQPCLAAASSKPRTCPDPGAAEALRTHVRDLGAVPSSCLCHHPGGVTSSSPSADPAGSHGQGRPAEPGTGEAQRQRA